MPWIEGWQSNDPEGRDRRITAIVLVGLTSVLIASQAGEAASAGKAWARWSSPEEAGFSSDRFAEAEVMWRGIDDAPVAAFFLVYKGKVLVSFGDETADFECHSVRKSFLSALIGMHAAEGNIDLGATLEDLGIDDQPPLNSAEKQATVRDLLMARSGVYHEAACETQEAKEVRPPRGSHPAGTYWYYNNWDFNALGTIFQQTTGRDVFREFQRRIARPLGMQDFKIARCRYDYEPEFSQHPCYKFRMSARDRARFGQLFLQQGLWGRKRIVPEDWARESVKPFSKTEWFTGLAGMSYGYMWWVQEPKLYRSMFRDKRLHHLHSFSANGNGGQLVMVLPDAEMVIVFAVDMYAGGDLQMEESVGMLETILTARPIVDLKLRRLRMQEALATVGDSLHVTAQIVNRSTSATNPTSVAFFLSPATEADTAAAHRLGTAEVPALAGGKITKVRLAIPLPSDVFAGRYRLIALADGDKENYDLRRANNLRLAKQILEVY